ncbi:MAG: GTPase HflX [Chloroflexi bacterium]|nr:GTPase HflX [Chloroflexota bacterium]
MPKPSQPTQPPSERAFLVGVQLRDSDDLFGVEDSLAELALLADTAGMEVVGDLYQKIDKPDPNTFIGSGKVIELKDFVEETLADTVIFDDELSPRHQRELEGILGEKVKVLDRTALILDIFAQHAHTREGALQVELAQYEYRLPRLTRQWTHLARQAGGAAGRGGTGGVGLRGPGETQLEVDRREISRKISYLKKELEKVRAHRGRYRAQRKRSAVPVVAIVGYTNAGKSTLLKALSNAEVYIADQLFATLDPTTRRVELPGGRAALFTDTVGFIQKLPTTLVAAFRATLEEIDEADLLLHVVDITHPNASEQAEAVRRTLEELEVHDIPVVTALNKIDRLPDFDSHDNPLAAYPNTVGISAAKRLGLGALLEHVQQALHETLAPLDVRVPYKDGQLISIFHEHGVIEKIEHEEKAVHIKGRIPSRLAARFTPYLIKAKRKRSEN